MPHTAVVVLVSSTFNPHLASEAVTYTARKIGAGANLKNIYQVLKQKQQDIERLKREIEALHVVLPMLEDSAPAQVAPQLRPSPIAIRH